MNTGSSQENENQDPQVAQNSAIRLEAPEEAPHVLPDQFVGASEQRLVKAQFVKALYRFIRARDRVFGNSLFSDPAWDILLLLYVGEAEGAHVNFDEICEALPASSETLMRCLVLLENRGLLSRDDKLPTTPLALSAKTFEMMEGVFALAMDQAEPAPGGKVG